MYAHVSVYTYVYTCMCVGRYGRLSEASGTQPLAEFLALPHRGGFRCGPCSCSHFYLPCPHFPIAITCS